MRDSFVWSCFNLPIAHMMVTVIIEDFPLTNFWGYEETSCMFMQDVRTL